MYIKYTFNFWDIVNCLVDIAYLRIQLGLYSG